MVSALTGWIVLVLSVRVLYPLTNFDVSYTPTGYEEARVKEIESKRQAAEERLRAARAAQEAAREKAEEEVRGFVVYCFGVNGCMTMTPDLFISMPLSSFK